MKKFILLALLSGFVAWAAPVLGDAKTPVACDLMSEQDALALVGGSLGEVFKDEEPPTVENGHDHNSVCGFFPKGYNIQEADLPPERGLQLQLHAMRTSAEAKSFYEHTLSAAQEMAKGPGSPLPDAKITPITGLSDAAFLQSDKSEIDPKTVYQIATIAFLKGSVMGQLQVWKKAAPVDEVAKSAAKKVISKLP